MLLRKQVTHEGTKYNVFVDYDVENNVAKELTFKYENERILVEEKDVDEINYGIDWYEEYLKKSRKL